MTSHITALTVDQYAPVTTFADVDVDDVEAGICVIMVTTDEADVVAV